MTASQIGFEFDLGYMAVENPIQLVKDEGSYSSGDLEIFNHLRTIKGAKVVDAWYEREVVTIIFENAKLLISLKDSDFRSPEAGTFRRHDTDAFIIFSPEE